MKSKKDILILSVKLLVSLTLIVFFLFNAGIPLVIRAISSFSCLTLFIAFAIYLVGVLLLTLKWKLFLPGYHFLKLLKLSFVAQFYSLLLPSQLTGEVVKAYKLGKNNKDAEMIAASVVIDKITALIGILLLGTFGIFLSGTKEFNILGYFFIIGIILCFLILFMFRIGFINRVLQTFLNWLGNRIPVVNKISSKFNLMLVSWNSYSKKFRLVAASILLGIVFQIICVALNMYLGNELKIHIGFYNWSWILGVITISLLLPVTIAGIGLREGGYIALLAFLDIPGEKAIAISLVIFGLQIIGGIIGGLLNLKKLNNSPENKQ